jgi:glycine/D-amino acid oxidase-like deaminating enzyme
VDRQQTEILIIGAGVIGSSVAMHLAQKGVTDVTVVDLDLEGTHSSSELNAGGVRGTWQQPLNITMSKLTIDYLAQHAQEVGYRDVGYLWLQTPQTMSAALKARDLQQSLGWPVEALDVAALAKRVPFIDKTGDLAGAVLGVRDGLVNPNLLKLHFRDQARKAGARFEDRVLIRRSEISGGKFQLTAQKFTRPLSAEEKTALYSQGAVGAETSALPHVEFQIEAKQVINCAGAWAGELARVLGYRSPCEPMRRQVCIFDCRDVDLSPYGMIIDTSGVYFHPEGGNGLAGFATPNEPNGFNFEYDGESFFMEQIWAPLYERSTRFERLKHLTGWAGIYEVSPDHCAILGEVADGELAGQGKLFEAHSFSGHGVMQSYSAGLLLAELIVGGKYETLDASPYSASRFVSGASRSFSETAII